MNVTLWELMAAARRWPAETSGERFTLVVLVSYMGLHDAEWLCFPGVRTLADDTLQSERTIKRHLARFESVGLISTRRRFRDDGRGRLSDSIVLDLDVFMGSPCHLEQTIKVTPATDQGDTGDTIKVTPDANALSIEQLEEQLVEVRSSIDVLCDLLADRIQQYRGGARPKITERWRRDMRLLIERGPLDLDPLEPKSPEKIRATLAAIFDEMAEPTGSNGFCWAATVTSPAKLREFWPKMVDDYRRMHGTRLSKGGQSVERVHRRMTGIVSSSTQREPLGLLAALEPKETA